MKTKYCLITFIFLSVLNNQLLAQDYGLDFGGSGGNRYVYCQNLFVSGSAPRTVEAWVYPRSFLTNAGVFECGHGASGSGLINFGLRIGNANEWKVELHDQTLVYNSTGTLNTWNHFALVYDGTNVKLYHNGNLVINVARSLNTYTSSFLIGRMAEGYFDGKIDEVRFWNIARTQAQIQSAMYTELAGNENGLLAEYRMNEGTGTTTLNSSTRSDLNSNYNYYLNAQIISNAVWGSGFRSFVLPTVTTGPASNITKTTAKVSGNISYLGVSNPIQHGVCWSTSENPTVNLTTKTELGGKSTIGSFTTTMTGLKKGTTYYARTYATSIYGTSYSSQVQFTTPPVYAGSGTTEDPYQIADMEDLTWITNNPSSWNKHFIQTADINAEECSSWPNGGWKPIGTISNAFRGSYNGQHHIITNLYIYRMTLGEENNYQGLFGYVFEATIKNLGLTSVDISGSHWVGALAGFIEYSTITQCYSDLQMVKGYSYIGGLIGRADYSSIRQCFSKCQVKGNWNTIGGLIGECKRSEVDKCYARGNVEGAGATGGFIGKSYYLTISYCYSTGGVYAVGQVNGGFIGNEAGSTFTAAIWDYQTSGWSTSGLGVPRTTAEMKAFSYYLSYNGNWDFSGEINNGTEDYWRIDESGNYNDGYPSLSWQGGPHQIKPVVTTQAVTNVSYTTATGNGNITGLGNTDVTQHGVCWGTTVNPTTVLETKTTQGAKTTTGAFTSNITGLTSNTTYYVRAYATNSAGTAYGENVQFCALNFPTVTTEPVTNISSTSAAGNGNISNLGYPASVTQHGVCWGTTVNPTTVLETKTTQGAKTTTGAFTSNITGLTSNTTYYVRAYATNSTGTAYGENVLFTTTGVPSALYFNGTNQYITGSVATTATDNITMEAWVKWDGQTGNRCIIYNGNSGGSGYGIFLYTGASPSQSITILCGGKGFVTSSTLLPTNTWHHVAVVRTSGVWKLYLNGIEKTLNNNTVTPNIPSGNMFIGSSSASAEHFKGFIDEVRFWTAARTQDEIRASMNTSLTGAVSGLATYYKLNEGAGSNINDNSGNSKNAALIGSAERGADVLIPDGTGNSAETAYQIVSLPHLYWITQNSSQWNKYYKQMNDIDASTTSYWSNGGWTPLGNNSTKFTGTYNGQGFKIDGLTINRPSDFQGFFGRTNGATISNLIINNAVVTGVYYSGILSGHNENNTLISNCSANGTVSGTYYAGGLTGYNDHSTIQRCHSSGSVSGSINIGGLIGFQTNFSNLSNSYSTANVTCTGFGVGGLNGWSVNSNNITNCYSVGIISGTAGSKDGLIGKSHDAVTNCFWDKTNNPSLGTSTPAENYGTGKTTEDMKNVETYTAAGWDFYGINGGTIWNIGNGRNNGYPYLQWQYSDDAPLPVELSSFTAENINNKVILNWKTETEVNNYGFEVERRQNSEDGDRRSEDGERKSEDGDGWQKIGFAAGAGNSNSPKTYGFRDDISNLSNVTNLLYRLKQIDNDGRFTYSKEVEVNISTMPSNYYLCCYPNPFNPETTIKFSLPEAATVNISVYNTLGEKAATIINGKMEAGTYEKVFSGKNLTSGIYVVSLIADRSISLIKKIVLMK